MTKQPYAQLELKAKIEIGGWQFCAVMNYINESWGDAYVIAPSKKIAGIVWLIGAEEFKTLLPPDNERWGVYQLPFKEPMKDIADLRSNFALALPNLKVAHEKASQH